MRITKPKGKLKLKKKIILTSFSVLVLFANSYSLAAPTQEEAAKLAKEQAEKANKPTEEELRAAEEAMSPIDKLKAKYGSPVTDEQKKLIEESIPDDPGYSKTVLEDFENKARTTGLSDEEFKQMLAIQDQLDKENAKFAEEKEKERQEYIKSKDYLDKAKKMLEWIAKNPDSDYAKVNKEFLEGVVAGGMARLNSVSGGAGLAKEIPPPPPEKDAEEKYQGTVITIPPKANTKKTK